MNQRHLLISLFVLLTLFFPVANIFGDIKADELVIQADGKIVLIITENNVLGVENRQKQKLTPQPQSQPLPKTEPLVPAHTQSTVNITPPLNSGKQIQVTITTTLPKKTSQPTVNTPKQPSGGTTNDQIKPSTQTITPSSTINTISKTVDEIVAQGTNGQPVLTIRSNQSRQLTIQQGEVQVNTALPLQIDTVTHLLSVPSTNESAQVSVLPKEALRGITNKGLLSTETINQAKTDLVKDPSGVNYSVQAQKEGKIFGIIPVQTKVEITMSAQNGRIIRTSQSLLFSILGIFIGR